MKSNEPDEVDLPLSANYKEVQVEHFVLDLVCEMSAKVFQSSVTFFLKGSSSIEDTDGQNIQLFKLDCYELCVSECWGFRLSEDEVRELSVNSRESYNDLQISRAQMNRYWQLYQYLKKSKEKDLLQFEVKKHCLQIKVPNFSSWERIVIVVQFKTQLDGPSLMWTNDQDGRPCVFTIGDSFNNRSLFPSQDMPQAMSTWHCNVTVLKSDQVVLMTGEMEPVVYFNKRNETVFQYHNSYRMPASTFALAVGYWSSCVLDEGTFMCDESIIALPRCRVHCPMSLKSDARVLFTKYLPSCFAAIASVLEPYHFHRLDILIAPDCFDSLGLACPNMLILSQSLLSPDLSLFHRVAHELCHTWFGILLGQKNWTEEWLTEGMCCYLEDVIHAMAMKWSTDEIEERNNVKSYLKYKVLVSEVGYTPSSLQMLRPDGEEASNSAQEPNCVKNGINSERSHIHYMKGFFLLKLLERSAGQDVFLSALKKFVLEYKGKLFSSQEILEYLFCHCPALRGSSLTVASLCQEWLDSPGLPTSLESFPYSIEDNKLYQQVGKEFEAFQTNTPSRKHKRKHAETSNHSPTYHINSKQEHKLQGPLHIKLAIFEHIIVVSRSGYHPIGWHEEKLLPDQIVLLLELMVENSDVRIPQSCISEFRDKHAISVANAEVQHAWCELVIQTRCQRWYGDVERFLHQHRAMGLYLYGELMISGCPKLQALAYRCYQHNLSSMPRATLKELGEILGIEHVKGETRRRNRILTTPPL